MRMKVLTTFICLFFNSFFLSQEIKINVVNQEKENLSSVNVQLLKNEKTINFKTTNENGVCSFVISENKVCRNQHQ